ncbi:MAG: hypothetical protein A2298_00225 [Gammaproteobacteria bacterium RIFOXYB2_FULL_38_6]|nr:MAG: hypothetical protein A2298_00225 [Gammaproteobacteria bacterium RIFOXYB2_FULL_38_6]
MFNNLRIVLVQPSHPGNIGAVARAMKVMGLQNLYLVQPKIFPDPKANMMACGADDVLNHAKVFDDFHQAIEDCHLIIGTTARDRTLAWTTFTPKEAMPKILAETQLHQTAILFGCEQWGLTNEQLACCHYRIAIPTDENFSSLNLAAAVQVICYELRASYLAGLDAVEKKLEKPADGQQVASFYERLEKLLIEVEFLHPDHPKLLMRRLKRLFNRVRLEEVEVNILQGIVSAVNEYIGKREKFRRDKS